MSWNAIWSNELQPTDDIYFHNDENEWDFERQTQMKRGIVEYLKNVELRIYSNSDFMKWRISELQISINVNFIKQEVSWWIIIIMQGSAYFHFLSDWCTLLHNIIVMIIMVMRRRATESL